MLAGYLPFDDDPANPEGDNINLLYKYIVSTPLTFPEYVTPHARDLLRRILVPDPRKRADLFEVARHSWLSEYAHVVGFITSSTTTTGDIANTTVSSEDAMEVPVLARSASVREPAKASKIPTAVVGDLSRKHGNVDQDAEGNFPKSQKDNKRRTVQVEYVAPRSQTVRGGEDISTGASSSKTRARSGSQGPVEVRQTNTNTGGRVLPGEKPLPQEPRESSYASGKQGGRPTSSSQKQQGMPPPGRPGREPPRSVSDNAFMTQLNQSNARPNTSGSMTSNQSGRPSTGLQGRGSSYGQPVAPQVAGTTAHGRMSQPSNGMGYKISSVPQGDGVEFGRPSLSRVPSKFARVAGFPDGTEATEAPQPRGQHKRSGTAGSISERFFGRRGSLFGSKAANQDKLSDKSSRKYPPVSMSGAVNTSSSRQSIDSRRSMSFGFGRKRSGSVVAPGDPNSTEKNRRFSFLPASLSLRQIGIGKESSSAYGSQPDLEAQNYTDAVENREAYLETPPPINRGQGQQGRSTYNTTNEQQYNASQNRTSENPSPVDRREVSSSPAQLNYHPSQARGAGYGQSNYDGPPVTSAQAYNTTFPSPQSASQQLEAPLNYGQSAQSQGYNRYPAGFNANEVHNDRRQNTSPRSGNGRGVLQKNNRKFEDAYRDQGEGGYGGIAAAQSSSGSSGAARKVMDFFRRRGKDRSGG